MIASELTFTADVPVEVRDNDSVFAVFTVSLPKLRLDALSVNFGSRYAPCPYRSEPPRPYAPVVELLLLTVSLPVTAPVAVGLNCTRSANVWIGFSDRR